MGPSKKTDLQGELCFVQFQSFADSSGQLAISEWPHGYGP